MKKSVFIYLVLLILVTAIVFTGCDFTLGRPKEPVDSPLQLVWKDAPDNASAILINLPAPEQLEEFAPSERLVLQRSIEGFLLIPASEVEEIIIWELEFDGAEFARIGEVYRNFDPQEEFILDLVVLRPEGGPRYELSLISDRGEATYYIAYDGRDGTPDIEYILLE